MADYDLWIWHSFFGTTGSHDDINMPQLFPVFARLVEDHDPGHKYQMLLSCRWHISKMINICEDNQHHSSRSVTISLCFTTGELQKDVERVFGVFQSRFDIVRYPAPTWSQE
jgi:hypothetical protein